MSLLAPPSPPPNLLYPPTTLLFFFAWAHPWNLLLFCLAPMSVSGPSWICWSKLYKTSTSRNCSKENHRDTVPCPLVFAHTTLNALWTLVKMAPKHIMHSWRCPTLACLIFREKLNKVSKINGTLWYKVLYTVEKSCPFSHCSIRVTLCHQSKPQYLSKWTHCRRQMAKNGKPCLNCMFTLNAYSRMCIVFEQNWFVIWNWVALIANFDVAIAPCYDRARLNVMWGMNRKLFTFCISNMNTGNLFTWYLSIDEIQRIQEKPMGPSKTSIKCHQFPEKISPDLWCHQNWKEMSSADLAHHMCKQWGDVAGQSGK